MAGMASLTDRFAGRLLRFCRPAADKTLTRYRHILYRYGLVPRNLGTTKLIFESECNQLTRK
jgi:hypothetical protein